MGCGWDTVASILVGAGALGAPLVALQGLESWKTQKLWERDHALCREILRAAQEFISALVDLNDSVTASILLPEVLDYSGKGPSSRDVLREEIDGRHEIMEQKRLALNALVEEAGIIWSEKTSIWIQALNRSGDRVSIASRAVVLISTTTPGSSSHSEFKSWLKSQKYLKADDTPVPMIDERLGFRTTLRSQYRELADLVSPKLK